MKIAFFEVFNEIYNVEKEMLEKYFPNDEVVCLEEKLSMENVSSIGDAEVVSVFTVSLINKEIIDLLPNLKFINVSATGFDNIDTEYSKTRGIKISNVPAYGSNTVAEFTFALLLNLSRRISQANNQLRRDDDFNAKAFHGFDLRGKTLGVIGTGKIGRNVIKIAKGFEMNVIAYDNFIDREFEAQMKFSYKSLEEVISKSDIITIHVPYSKENHHLINRENISKMKKGVYIINTARGGLIDTDALIWGLKEGIIAGEGLDVLEGERQLKEELEILSGSLNNTLEEYRTLLEDHVLIDMQNIIVTPHIAFYSKEAVDNIIKTTVDNIKGFIAGSPINLV